jgi:hypothetical protein
VVVKVAGVECPRNKEKSASASFNKTKPPAPLDRKPRKEGQKKARVRDIAEAEPNNTQRAALQSVGLDAAVPPCETSCPLRTSAPLEDFVAKPVDTSVPDAREAVTSERLNQLVDQADERRTATSSDKQVYISEHSSSSDAELLMCAEDDNIHISAHYCPCAKQ